MARLILADTIVIQGDFNTMVIVLLLLVKTKPVVRCKDLSLICHFLTTVTRPVSSGEIIKTLDAVKRKYTVLLGLLLATRMLYVLAFLVIMISMS